MRRHQTKENARAAMRPSTAWTDSDSLYRRGAGTRAEGTSLCCVSLMDTFATSLTSFTEFGGCLGLGNGNADSQTISHPWGFAAFSLTRMLKTTLGISLFGLSGLVNPLAGNLLTHHKADLHIAKVHEQHVSLEDIYVCEFRDLRPEFASCHFCYGFRTLCS